MTVITKLLARAKLFPPPLWGRVREGGRAANYQRTPTPNPSPQGGGERAARHG
jgi:hypothetical protein